jgi:hypothetical protein
MVDAVTVNDSLAQVRGIAVAFSCGHRYQEYRRICGTQAPVGEIPVALSPLGVPLRSQPSGKGTNVCFMFAVVWEQTASANVPMYSTVALIASDATR